MRKPLPLIPNSRGRRVIPFDHFINNDLEYLSGGVSSRKYATSVTKTKAANYGHIKWIEDLVPNRMNPVDETSVQFKEGDFNRLRIQDIEDMLLLLVQGKLTNLTVEERLAFNVSLRMFTRSVVIQRRVEDLQLGVKSYQKKLNLTKPDTYRSDLKRREAYTAYSNPRGFIYQNKDKKNRLMRIDELHKFSDGRLNDVRTFLNDRLKGIRMEYLPQTIWRQSDKDKAGAMIQAIDKQLKTRRIMRSLEKFVGGRPYEEHSSGYRFTVKMEILLEPTSNKLMVGRIFRDVKVAPTKSRANDKAILYPALLLIVLCRLLKDGRERYEHVGPEVTSSQDGKGHKMANRDYAWLMISRCPWEDVADVCVTVSSKSSKLFMISEDKSFLENLIDKGNMVSASLSALS
ncbi:hypothetical protein Tco_0060332 [Tanacetum coccineum]